MTWKAILGFKFSRCTGGFSGILICPESWESHVLGVIEITHMDLGSQSLCCPNMPGCMALPPGTMGCQERVMILSSCSRIFGGRKGHTYSWKKLEALPHQPSPSWESRMGTSVISNFLGLRSWSGWWSLLAEEAPGEGKPC